MTLRLRPVCFYFVPYTAVSGLIVRLWHHPPQPRSG